MRQNDDIIKRGNLWDVGLLPISDATGELTLNMCGKIKLKDSKTSTVVWTAGEHFEHVSISPVHKYTMPTWDDMCALKDIFFYETEEAYQVHPPKSEYINVMENCLHLWRLTNGARITDIAGMSKKGDLKRTLHWSHEEKYILQECVKLMHGTAEGIRAALYMQGIQPPEGEGIAFTMNYMEIVGLLFLSHTTHSGGTSTCNKCEELGVDPYEEIEFGFKYDPDYDPWC